jgi:hypothetical protein
VESILLVGVGIASPSCPTKVYRSGVVRLHLLSLPWILSNWPSVVDICPSRLVVGFVVGSYSAFAKGSLLAG